MTGFQVLRAATRQSQSWKNGVGVTSDIIVQPDGASLSEFDWRMSIAEIAEPAAFSMFDGIDRILTVLDGGLDVRLGSAASMRLDPQSDPLSFAGDAPVYAAPQDPVVRVLNVMTLRGKFQAAVERVRLCGAMRWRRPQRDCCCLLALQRTSIELFETAIDLERFDALLLVEGTSFSVSSDSSRRLLVTTFSRSYATVDSPEIAGDRL